MKPFYIGPHTEQEKESCHCIKCQNTYLLSKEIYNFRKSKKLNQLDSVTEFLALKGSISDEDLDKKHPELASPKEIYSIIYSFAESIVEKSDNGPTQYKNKWVFESYSSLVKKCNVRIIQIYGAAGHGKGMIDVMSSFAVKSILKRHIIGLDVWFGDSRDICEYLDMRKDSRMS